MEKWKNVRAEAQMNLKGGSLPREWTNRFYEVIKQHKKYYVTVL